MNKIFHPNIDEMYVTFSEASPLEQPHRLTKNILLKKEWLCLPRRYKSNLVAHVWYVYNNFWRRPDALIDRVFFTDMINIFGVFLPQLLRYPNPTDPLNGEAAAMLMREPAAYEVKVKGRALFNMHIGVEASH